MHVAPREWHPDDLAIYNGTDPQKPFLGRSMQAFRCIDPLFQGMILLFNLQGVHFHVHMLRKRKGERINTDTFNFCSSCRCFRKIPWDSYNSHFVSASNFLNSGNQSWCSHPFNTTRHCLCWTKTARVCSDCVNQQLHGPCSQDLTSLDDAIFELTMLTNHTSSHLIKCE